MHPEELLSKEFPLDENDFVTFTRSDEESPAGDAPKAAPEQ